MAKPEWGTKHTCPGCGIRFYDLKKNPAVCPSCDTKIVPQTPKSRKPVVAIKEPEPVAKPEVTKPDETDDTVDGAELDAVVLEIEDDDEDEDSLIEDTSDLEGDNGIDEVKEHMGEDVADDS